MGFLLKWVGRLVRTVRLYAAADSRQATKKADVAEHPKVFDHVGLLTNEPPGTAGLLFV